MAVIPRRVLVALVALVPLASPARGQVKSVEVEAVVGGVNAVAFSPDGKRVAAGGMDRTARVWDLDKPDAPLVLPRQPAIVRGVAFSPDGSAVCTAADHGAVGLFDARTGKARWTAELPCDGPRPAFAPDGKVIAVSGYVRKAGKAGSSIHLLDAATGRPIRVIEPDDSGLLCVAVSPDGTTVAAGGAAVHLYDLATGKHRRTVRPDPGYVGGLAFGPGGRVYAGGAGHVWAWDPATGEEKLKVAGVPEQVRAVAVSADGRRLAAAGDTGFLRTPGGGGARYAAFGVWDAGTGERVFTVRTEDIGSADAVALSPDGGTLACGTSGQLAVYSAATGERRAVLLTTVVRPVRPANK